MKTKSILIVACIGMMFAACSSRDDYSLQDDNTIRMKASIKGLSTRANAEDGYNGLQDDSFYFLENQNGGSLVNVYITNTGTETPIAGQNENGYLTYSPDVDGYFVIQGVYEYPKFTDGQNVDIYAIHPSDVTKTNTNFFVQDDQSTAADYRKSDLMCANKTNVSKDGNAVLLSFSHLMSKVIIKFDAESQSLAEHIEEIFLYGKTGVNITHNQATGISLGESLSPYYINIGGYNENGQSAIMIPQTISTSGVFITINFDDGRPSFAFYPSTPIELKPGHVHTFTVKLDDSKILLTGSSINPWLNTPSDDNHDVVVGNYW